MSDVSSLNATAARLASSLNPTVESLRAEARRRGVTVYKVRIERAEARGITKQQAVGKVADRSQLLSVVNLQKKWDNRPQRGTEGYFKWLGRYQTDLHKLALRLGLIDHDLWSAIVSPTVKRS